VRNLETPYLDTGTALREGGVFLIADLFVVLFPFIGLTQILDPLTLEGHNHIVLDGVGMLFAAIILPLCLGILRTLDFTLRSINPERAFAALGKPCSNFGWQAFR